jgi:uncharacterized protein (TIGR03382 family)
MNAKVVITSVLLVLPATGVRAATFVTDAPVDWLTLAPGRTHLLTDTGSLGATLDVTLGSGVLLPTTPAPTTLSATFWTVPPPILDSVQGDRSVPAIDIRVLPVNGLASYAVELVLPFRSEFILAIGQLYSDPVAASGPVELISNPTARLQYLGSFGWDNGVKPFDQPLTWDDAGQSLSPATGARGDSEVAFFLIDNADRVTISLPSAYGLATGDTVSLALGVVPEPTLPVLLLPALLVLVRRRREGRR